MSINKIIRNITGVITLISFVILLSLENFKLYDIILAIFGSSALSFLTAMISYNSDIKKLNRTVIMMILQVQNEVRKILIDYNKVLTDWNEFDFQEAHAIISKHIEEFFIYTKTIKFETGKEIQNVTKMGDINEIFRLYISLNGEIYMVGIYLKNLYRDDAYQQYKKCQQLDQEIVEKIKQLLKKEYGKNFSDINTIGLI